MTIRQSDDPSQADKYLAMRSATCDRRVNEATANPVRGARCYGGARDAAKKLRLLLLGASKVAPC